MSPDPGGPTQTNQDDENLIKSTDHTVFMDAPPKIGVFRLDVLLGRGGMGEVWRAFDQNLEREVALKLMRRELNENQEAARRFMREARAVARLNHPNIVQIYTFGEFEGAMYFVMELVEGLTVTQEIKAKTRLSIEQSVAIALQSVEGLDYALNRGIIHRDIKPSNLMLRPDGLVKIADFGLAKMRSSDSQMTAAGSTMGSPNYMSPEQARGEEADQRSDIYSLGITLYQMLTGELPFKADSPLSVLLKQIQEPLPEPEFLQGLVEGRLLQIIKRMTAKHVANRYQEYRELAQDLDAAVPAARLRMNQSSGLTITTSLVTPDPHSGIGTVIPPGQEQTQPVVGSTEFPSTYESNMVEDRPPLSLFGGETRTFQPEAAQLPQTQSPKEKSKSFPWRFMLGITAAAGLVLGVVALGPLARPPQKSDFDNAGVASPATTEPRPVDSESSEDPSQPLNAADPASQQNEPALTPTPVPIVTQISPVPTPLPVTPSPTPILTPAPMLTPIQTVTITEMGIVAPDLPSNREIPVWNQATGQVESLPAQTQVTILRAISRPEGGSGYLIAANNNQYFIAVDNLRVITRTTDQARLNASTPPSQTPPAGAASPPRPSEPRVIQLGAPNDTASQVTVFRDSAAIYPLRQFPRGSEFIVIEETQSTYQIKLPDGRTGYVLRRTTSPRGSLPVPPQ